MGLGGTGTQKPPCPVHEDSAKVTAEPEAQGRRTQVGRRGGRQRLAKLSVRGVSVASVPLDAANVSSGARLCNKDGSPSANMQK